MNDLEKILQPILQVANASCKTKLQIATPPMGVACCNMAWAADSEENRAFRAILADRLFNPNAKPAHNPISEFKYRRGYLDGMLAAAHLIADLRRAGFVRPNEISNIVGEFASTDLKRWASLQNCRSRQNPPTAAITTWADLRSEVFARDVHECALCGETAGL